MLEELNKKKINDLQTIYVQKTTFNTKNRFQIGLLTKISLFIKEIKSGYILNVIGKFWKIYCNCKKRDNDNWRNINNNTIFHVFLDQTNIVIEVVDPCYFQRFIIVQNMNTLKKKCGRIHPCQIIIIVMVDLRKLFYITCLYWIQSNVHFF